MPLKVFLTQLFVLFAILLVKADRELDDCPFTKISTLSSPLYEEHVSQLRSYFIGLNCTLVVNQLEKDLDFGKGLCCGMTSAITVRVPVQSSLQPLFEDSKQRSHRSLWLFLSWLFTFIHFCSIRTTHTLIRLPVSRGRHHNLNYRCKLDHLQCPFSFEKKREDLENGICEPRTLERQV